MSGFPTSENNSAVFGGFRYIMEKEGKMIQATNSGGVSTTPRAKVTSNAILGQNILGSTSIAPDPGRAHWIENVTISSDGPARAVIQISEGLFGNQTNMVEGGIGTAPIYGTASGLYHQFPASGGQAIITIQRLIYEQGVVNISVNPTGRIGDPLPNVSSSVNLTDLTADFNYTADHVVMVVGDSITHYHMGADALGYPYLGENLWGFRVVKQLNIDGISSRLVNKGFGFADSLNITNAFKAGFYDGIPYDLMVISCQTNDVAFIAQIPTTAHVQHIAEMIAHRDKYRPDASVIIMNATNSDFPSKVTYLQSYRDALRTYWQGLNGGNPEGAKIYFYDQSFAFQLGADATTDVNYQDTERIAGLRIHPSGLGHGLLFANTAGDTDNNIAVGQPSGIYEVVKKTNFYRKAKGLL